MDRSAEHGDDISGLWGTELSAGMAPAPREPKLPAHPDEEDGERIRAIEQDVRGLLELIERVESQLNTRLDGLEEKVTQVTEQLGSARPRPKGMARITEVIKPTKSR